MQQSRKIVVLFAVLMIATGVLIFAYPFISNALETRHATVAVQAYQQSVQTLQKEDIDTLKEAAKSYNDQLESVIDRNAQGQGEVTDSYIDLIQLGDALGYITIPKIDLNLPIYEGTGADVLAHGIGHLTQTSYPLGGESTHSALSGHRGMAEAELFTAAEFDGGKMDEFDAVAFGCPAMGAEELEDGEFAPMFETCESKLSGKKIALFGSYGWGDGEWMRTWEENCRDKGANLVCDSVICQETPDDEALSACRSLGEALA